MRIGAYVDAFNVYYGARSLCGRGTPGWRWLDLEGLAFGMINPQVWPEARLTRIVYCTAPRDREGDASSIADQLTYVNALRHHSDLVTVAKGSDVNVASHLLIDVLTGQVDAAMVFSNDSDLRFPLETARQHVPVATINPSASPTAHDLQGDRTAGAGRHWWRRLRSTDFRAHQLSNPVGPFHMPTGW